jgi:hypothetical protein
VQVLPPGAAIRFICTVPGDTNGLLYFLASNGRTWSEPQPPCEDEHFQQSAGAWASAASNAVAQQDCSVSLQQITGHAPLRVVTSNCPGTLQQGRKQSMLGIPHSRTPTCTFPCVDPSSTVEDNTNWLMVDLGIHYRCSLRRADSACRQLTDRFPPGLFPPATHFATETTLRQPVCALGFSREPLICWIGLFCGNTAMTTAWQTHSCGLPGRYCKRNRSPISKSCEYFYDNSGPSSNRLRMRTGLQLQPGSNWPPTKPGADSRVERRMHRSNRLSSPVYPIVFHPPLQVCLTSAQETM